MFVLACRLLRFLKAREWNVGEAEKQLKETVEWRRQIDPLNVDCRWCHERPGYHCIVRILIFTRQQQQLQLNRSLLVWRYLSTRPQTGHLVDSDLITVSHKNHINGTTFILSTDFDNFSLLHLRMNCRRS